MDTKFPMLVALSGYAGSGKSVLAEELCGDEFAFVRVKFAAPLKDMLRTLLLSAGVLEDHIEKYVEGELKEEPSPFLKGRSPRHLMLTLGTEWGRDLIHPDIWVHIWKQRVRVLMDHGYSVVVDDLRFENEEMTIRELNGVVLQVDRGERKTITHVSEAYKPKPDYVITNNSTIPAAMKQVVEALNI